MGKNHYIIPIFVPHEGCPHNCVFCNQDKITGEEEKVNKNYVKEIIEEYLSTINSNATIEVSFFGGTFTAININKQKELLSVAKEYKDKNKINFIRLSTRPDYIDDFILTHLKSYGVDIIELGIQSLDKDVLEHSGRGHSDVDVIKASKLIKEYGFILGHQIMLGLPKDDMQKDLYTAEKSIEMKPDICRIYPALVIKETPMEEMFLKGIYKPYDLEESIKISKIIYKMYLEKNIKVIRIGLQPTDTINEGKDIVAGPFHPAYRELVEGSIINENLEKELKGFKGEVIIKLHPKNISKLYCNKKIYFNKLKEKLDKDIILKIVQDSKLAINVFKIIKNSNEFTMEF